MPGSMFWRASATLHARYVLGFSTSFLDRTAKVSLAAGTARLLAEEAGNLNHPA